MRIGIIGEGISHSCSPHIHNLSADKLGIKSRYEIYQIKKNNIIKFLDDYWELGGLGLNITTPYKEYVGEILGSKLTSLNTIVRGKDEWRCYSTDGEGLSRALYRFFHKNLHEFSRIIILGSGGVVSAILSYLDMKDSNSDISILRRNSERDHPLKRSYSKSLAFYDFNGSSLMELLKNSSKNTLLIQATSAAHTGQSLESLIPALKYFQGSAVDLVYGYRSEILESLRLSQKPCIDGTAMLIEQARLCQEIWWGKSLDFETIYNHLNS